MEILGERVGCDKRSADRQYILSRKGFAHDMKDWRDADCQDETDVPAEVLSAWRALNPLETIGWSWGKVNPIEKKNIKAGFLEHVRRGGDWLTWKADFNKPRAKKPRTESEPLQNDGI